MRGAARSSCLLASAALACAAWLLAGPPPARAWSVLGGSLSLAQRDLRVYPNFSDPSANDDSAAEPSFPGATGAARALWKAALEWGSELHGNGSGDPHQPGGLGSGNANFDPSWQGLASAIGGSNDNVLSELTGSDGGVLAFCETPISDGWRIRFYDTWTWADGPGTSLPAGHIDLQGVATHELGHALGLGHSSVLGATMFPSVAGNAVSQRSISADDSAGLQSIYGLKSPGKPRIFGSSLSGSQLTLQGTNFSASGNEVWFTRAGTSGSGTPIKVSGLKSDGSTLSLSVPATAGPGDVLVKNNGNTHASLSNAWPLDTALNGASGGPPAISAFEPDPMPNMSLGPDLLVLHGSGFALATGVLLDGQALSASQVLIVDDSRIELVLPPPATLGVQTFSVASPAGQSASLGLERVASSPPVLEASSSFVFSGTDLELRLGAAPGSLALVLVSTQLGPSLWPGVVALEIGNGFQDLFLLQQALLPACGLLELDLSLSGLAFGTNLHFQAALLDKLQPTLPLISSNLQSATFYY